MTRQQPTLVAAVREAEGQRCSLCGDRMDTVRRFPTSGLCDLCGEAQYDDSYIDQMAADEDEQDEMVL